MLDFFLQMTSRMLFEVWPLHGGMSCVFYHMFTVFSYCVLLLFYVCVHLPSWFQLLYGYIWLWLFHYTGDKFVPDIHIVLNFFN